MRILMITALDVWALASQGGAASLSKTLEAYGRRGHKIRVVSPTIGANHHFGEPPVAPPELPGVEFHQFHLPSLGESRLSLPETVAKADQKLRFALLFPWLAARRASRLLRSWKPDLLYGYEVHGVLAQRLVRRAYARPLVARFQGTVMQPHLDSRVQLLRRYEEVLALKGPADLYIMTNDGTRGDEVLARLNPAAAGRVRFWRNGIDLGRVRPPSRIEAEKARTSLGVGKGDFVLVTAARLARWKRIDRAIDALALLHRDLPNARLIVVGDGEERLNLERQASEAGVGTAVTFAGAVPQNDVQRHLWAGDVFLSLNELSNVGNPLLEAMTAGRCIVTIDEGDTRELVQDGTTGILLPQGNPSLVAGAVRRLAEDDGLRKRLGRGARRFAEENFWSWELRMEAELAAVEALVRPATEGALAGV